MPKADAYQAAAITNFPVLLPDETMLGYLTRVAMLSQLNLYGVSSLALGLNDRLEPPWVVPSNLDYLCEAAQGTLGTAHNLAFNHTVFPVVAPFMPSAIRARLLRQIAEPRPPRTQSGTIRTASWESGAPGRMAWCPQCALADESRYGFSYWHREHQLDACSHCIRHQCPLVTGCGLCGFPASRHVLPALPSAKCPCGREPRPVSLSIYIDSENTLVSKCHDIIRYLFDNPLPLDETDHIAATLQEKVSELGLSTKRGLRLGNVSARIEAMGDLRPLVSRWGKLETAIRILTNPLRRGRPSPNLAVNAFLIGILFDSGEEFRGALERNRLAGTTAIRRRNGFNCLASQKFGSRKEMRESESPYLRRRVALDEATSIAIRQRHAAVLASLEQPIRFTRAFFLAGVPTGRSIARKYSDYPLTAAAIRELSETDEQYVLRRATWLIRTEAGKVRRDALLPELQKTVKLPIAVLEEIWSQVVDT